MSRYAFIIGSNGIRTMAPLQYARTDAAKVARCFGSAQCGFQVYEPEDTDDRFDLLRRFSSAAQQCEFGDTFISYFAGHGILDRGELHLVWNSRKDDVFDAIIPVKWILDEIDRCLASNKLLILDCCNAGAARERSGAGIPIQELAVESESHLLLMASERVEPVREYPELGGSFLSTKLCEALDSRFREADDDGDGRISFTDMMKWLENSASVINRGRGKADRIPTPFQYGLRKNELFFTNENARWSVAEVEWPNESSIVVMPVAPPSGSSYALAVAKYPVTNAQYRRFVEETKHREPQGERLQKRPAGSRRKRGEPREGTWVDSFRPWADKAFADPDHPVVCISYGDALAYCKWIDRQISHGWAFIPNVLQWQMAAFGEPNPLRSSKVPQEALECLHHRASSPAPIDLTGSRANRLGVSDAFGNVWEWCTAEHSRGGSGYVVVKREPELRGGGFLDDLNIIPPFLDSIVFPDGPNLRHFDLGFRIAGLVPLSALPEVTRLRLRFCREGSAHLWASS